MADAISRVQAYEAAGVDALFLVGIRTREQLEAMAAATHLPLMLGGVGAELRDLDYLSAMRVRICLQGHQPFMAAVRAVHDTLKALRDGTPPANLAHIASPALMKQVSREDEYAVWIDRFLGGPAGRATSADTRRVD